MFRKLTKPELSYFHLVKSVRYIFIGELTPLSQHKCNKNKWIMKQRLLSVIIE